MDFELDIADGGAAQLGDDLGDADEDERYSGRDEEGVHRPISFQIVVGFDTAKGAHLAWTPSL